MDLYDFYDKYATGDTAPPVTHTSSQISLDQTPLKELRKRINRLSQENRALLSKTQEMNDVKRSENLLRSTTCIHCKKRIAPRHKRCLSCGEPVNKSNN